VSNKILMPYAQYNLIATTPRATFSDMTVLNYLQKNNIAVLSGTPLTIAPVKWASGAGVGGTDRMVAYNQGSKFLRFPMYPLTPLKDIETPFGFTRSYQWMYGQIEWVYPNTALYRDGI